MCLFKVRKGLGLLTAHSANIRWLTCGVPRLWRQEKAQYLGRTHAHVYTYTYIKNRKESRLLSWYRVQLLDKGNIATQVTVSETGNQTSKVLQANRPRVKQKADVFKMSYYVTRIEKEQVRPAFCHEKDYQCEGTSSVTVVKAKFKSTFMNSRGVKVGW